MNLFNEIQWAFDKRQYYINKHNIQLFFFTICILNYYYIKTGYKILK